MTNHYSLLSLAVGLCLSGCPRASTNVPNPTELDVGAQTDQGNTSDMGLSDTLVDAQDTRDAAHHAVCEHTHENWNLACSEEAEELCEGSRRLTSAPGSSSLEFEPRGPGAFHLELDFDTYDPNAGWRLVGSEGVVARSVGALAQSASVELGALQPYALEVDWAQATSGTFSIERASYGARAQPWPLNVDQTVCHSVGFYEDLGSGSTRSYYAVAATIGTSTYTATLASVLDDSKLVLEFRRPASLAPMELADAASRPATASVEVTRGQTQLSFRGDAPALLIVRNVDDFVGGPGRVALEPYQLTLTKDGL